MQGKDVKCASGSNQQSARQHPALPQLEPQKSVMLVHAENHTQHTTKHQPERGAPT